MLPKRKKSGPSYKKYQVLHWPCLVGALPTSRPCARVHVCLRVRTYIFPDRPRFMLPLIIAQDDN